MAQKYKLIALDLDGTTLNNAHELSELTITTLRELSAKGIVIAIATGRSAPSVFGYLSLLSLPQQSTFVIAYNGSCGFVVEKDCDPVPIFSVGIAIESARTLLGLTEELGLITQYYNGATGDVQAVCKSDEHRALLGRYAALVGKPQVLIDSYDEAIAKSLPAKLLVLTNDPDYLIEVCEERLPKGMFHMIRGSPHPFFVGKLIET